MNVSMDGYLSGPSCELDWHFDFWNAEMAEYLCEKLKMADTILFGRVTYTAMAAYWSSKGVSLSSAPQDREFAEMAGRYNKIVFSTTLTECCWNNTHIVNEEPSEYINSLQLTYGGNMMVYGSAKLVQYLIEKDMIDEFHLWVHPVILGNGKLLFNNNVIQKLQLRETKKFRNGVVTFCYTVK